MIHKDKKLLWLAFIFPMGFLIGTYLGIQSNGNSASGLSFGKSKDPVSSVIDYVDKMYVDDVERERLMQVAIEAITKELDPHTAYISPQEMAVMQEPMQGHFYGIGVEFLIIEDTINVLKTIPGGPSEKAGLIQGDKILFADDVKLFGDSANNALVLQTLKGEEGSQVEVVVQRHEDQQLFTITRGSIPIPSVLDHTVLQDSLAFIKIVRFAEKTDKEFFAELNEVVRKNIKHVVIDLRDNGGGYLSSTVNICEQLLSKGDLITYTEGKARPRKEFRAKGNPRYQNLQFYVLINENSASASEIMAGAFQDNDRGLILGRRSFGKGLVQEEHVLPQQAALRLTVARYYTPSGRSIQKTYLDSLGNNLSREEYYGSDAANSAETQAFYTKNGRSVYGGGGILPDIALQKDIDSTQENAQTWTHAFGSFSESMEDLLPLMLYGQLNVDCFRYLASNNFDFGNKNEFDKNFQLTPLLKFIEGKHPDLSFSSNSKNYSLYDANYFKALCARYLFKDAVAQEFNLRIDREVNEFLKLVANDKLVEAL